VLQAIIAAGITIMHKCGGEAKCGSCHIFVTEGRKVCPRCRSSKTKSSTALSVSVPSHDWPVRPLWGLRIFSIEMLGFRIGRVTLVAHQTSINQLSVRVIAMSTADVMIHVRFAPDGVVTESVNGRLPPRRKAGSTT